MVVHGNADADLSGSGPLVVWPQGGSPLVVWAQGGGPLVVWAQAPLEVFIHHMIRASLRHHWKGEQGKRRSRLGPRTYALRQVDEVTTRWESQWDEWVDAENVYALCCFNYY